MGTQPSNSPNLESLPGRVLGLDPGEQRVGIAVSDVSRRVALGLPSFQAAHGHSLVRTLRDLCGEYGVAWIVVGNPLTLSGEVGSAAEAAGRLARRLRRDLGIPVDMWDERLTSVAADRVLQGEGAGRGSRDRIAATLILQGYLDRHNRDRHDTDRH